MTDERKTPPEESADFGLPVSSETDPTSATIISRSETLKRMITAFQTKELPAINVVDASLDVDRSVEPPVTASAPEASDSMEKTVFRPPSLPSTPAAPAVTEPAGAMTTVPVEPVLSAGIDTAPMSVGQEAARRLERRADEPPPPAVTPKADESKPSKPATVRAPEPKVIDALSIATRPENALTGSPDEAPWTLQQFFNGEIDLDVELTKRFPTMPMLSIIKFRTLGTNSSRRVATLSTQDGAAALVVDADVATKVVQLSFTLWSMLTLRFGMSDLSDMDRNRWVELMRRDQGGLAFLWGPTRWAQDYMICISRKYFTNFYAFSPHNFEAGVRLTPAVTKQLLDWMEELWTAQVDSDDEQPPLLTW